MKTLISTLIIGIVILAAFTGHALQYEGDVYIRHVEGDVLVKPGEGNDWLPASINTPLMAGDRVWAADNGRSELFLREGIRLGLNHNSYIEIGAQENDANRVYLAEGQLFASGFGSQAKVLAIETPSLTLIGYNDAVFKVDVNASGDTDVSVFKGEITIEGDRDRTRITGGQRVIVRKDSQYLEEYAIAPYSEWDRWNLSRNEEYAKAAYAAGSYLPEELSAYAYDFSYNGRWVNAPDYGYVWTPTAVIAAEWSPYRYGRWVWIGGEYTWISYEPWGWAPYHYGRWTYIGTIGWAWVPPPKRECYWGPGYVAWVHTPTHISWVPLGPRETYYGHGNHGPYSVNIRNVNVNRITVNEHYRNVNARNGVITVHRDTFLYGRRVSVNQKENLFKTQKVSPGAPPIKPVKETFMPSIRELPRGKQPPVRVELEREKIRERTTVRAGTGFIKQEKAFSQPARNLPVKEQTVPLAAARLKERNVAPINEKEGLKRTKTQSPDPRFNRVSTSEKSIPGTQAGKANEKNGRPTDTTRTDDTPKGKVFAKPSGNYGGNNLTGNSLTVKTPQAAVPSGTPGTKSSLAMPGGREEKFREMKTRGTTLPPPSIQLNKSVQNVPKGPSSHSVPQGNASVVSSRASEKGAQAKRNPVVTGQPQTSRTGFSAPKSGAQAPSRTVTIPKTATNVPKATVTTPRATVRTSTRAARTTVPGANVKAPKPASRSSISTQSRTPAIESREPRQNQGTAKSVKATNQRDKASPSAGSPSQGRRTFTGRNGNQPM